MQPSLSEFLFSAKGRISRSQLWLRWIVPYLVIFIVLEVLSIMTRSIVMTGILGLFVLAAIWPSIATYIKRAHDRGRSGWFVLLFLVPIVSLWPLIELLFLPGTPGGNDYGPNPLPAS